MAAAGPAACRCTAVCVRCCWHITRQAGYRLALSCLLRLLQQTALCRCLLEQQGGRQAEACTELVTMI